jgi:radical SAM superfamily enzyme YgiQ (UPF0313 family)
MGKNILLVTTTGEQDVVIGKKPSEPYLGKDKRLADQESYPIGLAYLHSYLEKNGYIPTTLHLNYYYEEECYEEILSTIEKKSPDFVAFQMLTVNRTSTCKAIEKVHIKYPGIKIILGGIHASLLYKELIKRYPFVFIVLGEGEETLIELLNEFPKKKPNYRKIKGLFYLEKGKPVINPTRPLIEDLDSLPFPAHNQFINKNVKRACILTSRGCPFKCSFCCINPFTKRKVRFRSVENVLAEISEIIKNFPWIKEIWVFDDTFFLDNKRVIEICKGIIKMNKKITFTCCGRIKPISKEMIYYLEKANFKSILLGVETGSEEVLLKTGKAITPKEIEEAWMKFKHSPITLRPYHIIGLPGENMKTATESARFFRKLQKIKYDYIGNYANYLRVYPGTNVYEMLKEKSMIDDSYWESDKPCPFFLLENTTTQLHEYGEIFLNHVCLDRIITPKGFAKQWMMIPSIIPRIIKKISMDPQIIKKVFARILKK